MGGDILYRWGNPSIYHKGDISDRKLFAPHGVNWINNSFPGSGNILIFNNEHSPSQSAVIEIESPVLNDGSYPLIDDEPFGPNELTWFYQSDFFSASHSGAFRLSNGNTFITSFKDNKIFEVDYEGVIQWEYVGDFSNVHRAIKYSDSYFNDLIAGDVNLDGETNILDVVAIINIILTNENNPSVDLNNDGIINVLDIVYLINIIFNQ